MEKIVGPYDRDESIDHDGFVISREFEVYENGTGEEVVWVTISSFCGNKEHKAFHELTDGEFSVRIDRVKTCGIAAIHIGGRTYSETVDMDEIWEHFNESESIGEKPTWEHYTRPVRVEGWSGLSEINGNHFLFGWVESLLQSDRSPMFCLEEGQRKGVEIEFEFS